jgi:hypothetical protein
MKQILGMLHPQMQLFFLGCSCRSHYRDVLHHFDMVTHGQFAFIVAESRNYLACFKVETHSLERGMVVNLNLDWRTGIATRDWDAITKKEKLEVSIARTSPIYQFKHFLNQITYSLWIFF